MKPKRISPGTTALWIEQHKNYEGDDCLFWPFARCAGRYGSVTRNGKSRYAHREMCEAKNGPPPTAKHEAAHSCGRGFDGCVNPNHLSWKTRHENQSDRMLHGTVMCGERHGNCRLRKSQVLEIIASSESQKTLAERFGVSISHIGNIRTGTRRVNSLGERV